MMRVDEHENQQDLPKPQQDLDQSMDAAGFCPDDLDSIERINESESDPTISSGYEVRQDDQAPPKFIISGARPATCEKGT